MAYAPALDLTTLFEVIFSGAFGAEYFLCFFVKVTPGGGGGYNEEHRVSGAARDRDRCGGHGPSGAAGGEASA